MGDIFKAIFLVLPLISKLINLWREKDVEKSKAKREAIDVAIKGLDTRDPSAITLGIDRFNRIK